jgi:hypothetical protein
MKIGFFGLLQVVFIALKVTDYIDWSWWLVFVPFYTWLILHTVVFVLVKWLDKVDPLWRFRK